MLCCWLNEITSDPVNVDILSEKNMIKELKAEIELLKAKSNISAEKREIAKLKSEIESLKRDRDQVTAIIMRQNPTISPLPIISTTKRNALLAGVVAFGKTLYQCRQELISSFEGWLIVKIRHSDRLPVVGRINLNKRMPVPKEAIAHG